MLRYEFSGTLIVCSVALLGCGDPVPPPAEAAATVSIGAPINPDPGSACSLPPHVTIFGAPPDATSSGDTLVDGDDGADVRCTVTGSGSYSFSGSVKQGRQSFGVTGEVTPGGTGTGTANMFDSVMAISLASPADVPCTFYVNQGSLTVESGAIWAGFSCPKFSNSGQTGIWCQASGFFVFKSCGE